MENIADSEEEVNNKQSIENDAAINVSEATAEESLDEFCPDKDYDKGEKLTNENSDILRVVFSEPSLKDEEMLD